MHGARDAWLGLGSAGKPYYDLQQALRDMGIRREDLDRLGVRIAKIGMTFPLEPEFTKEFAEGLRTILVVEEKRSFLELQLREILYNLERRPTIIGKQDEHGGRLLRAEAELDPEDIVKVLARLLSSDGGAARLRLIHAIEGRPKETTASRNANFLSGCPPNRPTVRLEGHAAAGR